MTSEDQPRCRECDRPASYAVAGELVFCLQHAREHNSMLDQAQRHNATMINYLRDEIAAATGYRAPRLEIPPVENPVTVNYISITGGTIGVVNTGTVEEINVRIGTLEAVGQQALANAAKAFGQALLDTDELRDDVKAEVTEQLQFLLNGAISPPAARPAPPVWKAIIASLERSVATAANVATLWQGVGPLIAGALGG